MRGWMENRPNYNPPVQIGEVMRGMTVGEVVESKLEGFGPGYLVTGLLGWQEWALGDGGLRKLPEGTDPTLALSVLGITAYFGLLEVGQPKPDRQPRVGGRPAAGLRERAEDPQAPLHRRELRQAVARALSLGPWLS